MNPDTAPHQMSLISSFIARTVDTLAPDEDIATRLLLGTPRGWMEHDLTPLLTDVPDVEEVLTDLLPQIVERSGATQVIYVTATWLADMHPADPAEERALHAHLEAGGKIADWPHRRDAISALFVGQGEPTLTLTAMLERHAEAGPTIARWSIFNGFNPELVSALSNCLNATIA